VLDRPAPNWAKHLHRQTYRLSIVGTYVIVAFGMMLIIGGLSIDLSFRWTAALALACAVVNLMESAIMLSPDAYVSSTVRQQLAMLMFVGIGLAVFPVAFGIAEGRQTLRHPERGIRLLIAPDAIDGLKRLGAVFPDATNGGASAEPTETVSVLYRGESMYVLRTKDGKVVQVKNDKVWSIASEP
jgi:hypothetical protein